MNIKDKNGEIHSVIRFMGASIGTTRCHIKFPDSMENWEWVKKEATCKKCLKKSNKGVFTMESFGVKKCGVNDPPKTAKPDIIPHGQGEKSICPHCNKEF